MNILYVAFLGQINYKQTGKWIDIKIERHFIFDPTKVVRSIWDNVSSCPLEMENRQIDTQINRQIDRQTDIQIDRQIDRRFTFDPTQVVSSIWDNVFSCPLEVDVRRTVSVEEIDMHLDRQRVKQMDRQIYIWYFVLLLVPLRSLGSFNAEENDRGYFSQIDTKIDRQPLGGGGEPYIVGGGD